MANLYGRLQGSRGEATRLGNLDITAKLETWEGSIRVTLDKNGQYTVLVGDKSSPNKLVAVGNVNTAAGRLGVQRFANGDYVNHGPIA